MIVNATTQLSNERILIIDSSSENQLILRLFLKSAGFEILSAHEGDEGLAVAKESHPALILLGLGTQGMDGFEAGRRLKQDPSTRAIPIIAVTDQDRTGCLADAFQLGVADYITQPITSEEVLCRVETHLRISRLTRSLVHKNNELESVLLELERQQAERALSLAIGQQPDRFQCGGTLRPDSPAYVERQADRELYAELVTGRFCYVLTARQMGKSSLMARTARRLEKENITVVTMDLTAIGQNLSPEQWYNGIISRMGWQLDLEDEFDEFWIKYERLSPIQRMIRAIQEVAMRKETSRLVVFVDEIDAVRSLPFSTDEFFAAIRECHNRRAHDDVFNSVTFCIMGVATPEKLINDPLATPFNIGRRIQLGDFSLEEAAPLVGGLDREFTLAKQLLDRVYFWTSGHPYLTQRMFKIMEEDRSIDSQEKVDSVCSQLFLSQRAREQDDNLLYVRERCLRSEYDTTELLRFYEGIRLGNEVPDNPTDPLVNELEITGLIKEDNGYLRVRNRIYENVFDQSWIQRNLEGVVCWQ